MSYLAVIDAKELRIEHRTKFATEIGIAAGVYFLSFVICVIINRIKGRKGDPRDYEQLAG
jgi:hypothetical protein